MMRRAFSVITKRAPVLFRAFFIFAALAFSWSQGVPAEETPAEGTLAEATPAEETEYFLESVPLERNGYALHLDCMTTENADPARQILLVHGATYSSHEFDVNYEDYSLVRRLAREGYHVWRLDIAGYGRSEAVEDGFLPDTAYAAEDIRAAVEKIVQVSGRDAIDVFGWSWGTMTTGRFAAEHPEHIRKLVLYAPLLMGLGEKDAGEAFNHNTWAGAAEDFQTNEDGSFDEEMADPVIIEMYCSSCWHYDGDSSPRAWRKDAFVDEKTRLIDLERISVPTYVIYGTKDPYMNLDALEGVSDELPEGSEVKEFEGGSHILLYEKPFYREFQDGVVDFLER